MAERDVASTGSARQRRARVGATQRDSRDDSQPRCCFVIAPIGKDGSETRKRSDQLLRHIIYPVVTELGYEAPLRADHIAESGRITRQVIQHIVDDDLVVADLTDSNPNVYYELAIRHALKKPFVQILSGDDPLPFDVADQRTIMVDHRDLDSVANAKEELRRQVSALESDQGELDTPLTFALDIASLQGSSDPGDRTQAELLEVMHDLRRMTRRATLPQRAPASLLADVQSLRHYVETTVADGSVTDEDVDLLVTQDTSVSHDQWVARVVRAKMSPFLPVTRSRTREPSHSGEDVPF